MERIDITNAKALECTLEVIKNGGVVVAPTDTVYGLITDATNIQAVEKIFAIKKRDPKKPLGIFVSDQEMFKTYADVDPNLVEKLWMVWPGAFTAVLKSNHALQFVDDTIGVRVPNYDFLMELMKKLEKPLVQTSANISGSGDFTDSSDVLKNLQEASGIDLFVDGGRLPDSMASTGVNFMLTPPQLFREGAISREKLEVIFGKLV